MSRLLACFAVTDQALGQAADLAAAVVSEREEMLCFDDLPPRVRAALTDHPLKLTAQSVLGRLALLRRRLGPDAERALLAELDALRDLQGASR